jgi:hypothetical protein
MVRIQQGPAADRIIKYRAIAENRYSFGFKENVVRPDRRPHR